jgi:hypothetical protein
VHELGRVEAVDGLGEGVVIRVATGPEGADVAGLGEPLGVADGQVLGAAVAVMSEPRQSALATAGDGHLQRVEGEVGAQRGRHPPAEDAPLKASMTNEA